MDQFNWDEWLITSIKMIIVIFCAIYLHESGIENKDHYTTKFDRYIGILKPPMVSVFTVAILFGLIGVLDNPMMIIVITPIYILCYWRGLYKRPKELNVNQ